MTARIMTGAAEGPFISPGMERHVAWGRGGEGSRNCSSLMTCYFFPPFLRNFLFLGWGGGGGIPICGVAAGFHQICTIFRTHWNVSTWRKSLWIVFWEQAPHLANTCKMTKGHCLTHILISHEVRSVEICEFTDLEGEKSPCLHFTWELEMMPPFCSGLE